MKRLDELNIPTRVEGSVPFKGNEALAAVCSIYSAIADTENNIAVYSALVCKIPGFFQDDLINFANNICSDKRKCKLSLDAGMRLNESSSDRSANVAEFLSVLRDVRKSAAELSPAVVFSMIMDRFRIFEKVSSENLEVLFYALELLRAAESSGAAASASDGAAFIRNLLSGDSGEERCLSLSDSRDCVHLANLHKVKGLEAPVVILAAAGHKGATPENRIEYNETGTSGYVFEVNNGKMHEKV